MIDIICLEGTVHSGKTRLCQLLLKDGFIVQEESDRIPQFSLRLERKSLSEIGISNYLKYQKEHIDICIRQHLKFVKTLKPNSQIIIDRDLISGLMFVKSRLPQYYEVTRNYLLSQVANLNIDAKFRIAFLAPYLEKIVDKDQDHRMFGDLSISSIASQLRALIDILQDEAVKKILLERYYHNPKMKFFKNHQTVKEDFISWIRSN